MPKTGGRTTPPGETVRLDWLDIEGLGPAVGRFRFPSSGLGIWAAPNGSGKSTLARAVTIALYGNAETPSPGWLALRVSLDDGTALVIRRDLADGTAHVSDQSGRDVTGRYWSGPEEVEPGERITGLTRAQFEAVVMLRFEELSVTIGHRVLRHLLNTGRGHGPDGPGAPGRSADEVAILHTAREEIAWKETGSLPTPKVPTAPHAETRLDGLRRLREGIDRLDARLEERRAELETLAAQLEETQAEASRLEMLTGAEPEDAEKLQKLLGLTRRIQETRERLRIEEDRFVRELKQKGRPIDKIRGYETSFGRLDGEELSFLEAYRQKETILRGNQAVTRSELRLDENQLEDIARARKDGTRLAILPLAVSIVGLFGSILVDFLPPLPVGRGAVLAVGLVAAAAGSYLLWRAKNLREAERLTFVESLGRKREQMDEMDRDAKKLLAHLGLLAQLTGQSSPSDVLKAFSEWRSMGAEIAQLDSFRKRAEEIQAETAGIREKLGSFLGGDTSTLDLQDSSLVDLEATYQDYVRFFELRHHEEEVEGRRGAIEEDLAAIENEKADLRERILEVLEESGVDTDRELDEAIEMFAIRQPSSSSSGLFDAPAENAEWAPALSARVEAILRRFLPDARDVEIDGNLVPRWRLDPKAAPLSFPELQERLSPATIDLVCLALRLSIVETLSSSGERIPVILDDPLVRTDDIRHDRALDFLVTDACARTQIVLLTAQEVKSRWFLHQFPQHRERITPLRDAASAFSASSSAHSGS